MTQLVEPLAYATARVPWGGLARFWIRGLSACVGFGLSLGYCVVLLLWRRDRLCISRDTARLMSRFCCTPLGIRVMVHDAERLQATAPCVIIANHQSFLDYPILGRVLPANTKIVGKAEMRGIPIVGAMFKWAGHVFIDRRASATLVETMAHIVRAIRHERISVWMFPEGTRRRSSQVSLLPFRSGAFRIAASAGVAIVPVVVDELKPDTDIAGRRFRRRTVNVRVLAPIFINLSNPDHVAIAMDQAQSQMRACLMTGRGEVT